MILFATATLLLLFGCAAEAPPRPPRLEQPEKIEDLAVAQTGRVLEISFTQPRQATDGERLTKPLEVEIFRVLRVPAQSQASGPAAARPWMTLTPDDLHHYERGQKIVLAMPFSAEEFSHAKGATFTFTVRSLTRGLRHRPILGELSKPAEIILLDASDRVEHVQVIPHEKALEVRWSPLPQMPQTAETAMGQGPGTLFGYRIYRSATGAPNSFQLLAETGSTAYFDPNFEFNRTYSYKVRGVFREKGQTAETEDSQAVIVTPRDTYPPEAPKELSGIYTRMAVELIWTANTEPDLAGYNVYRREEGEATPKRLNKDLIRVPIFRDDQADPEHKYLYRVTAVDLSNNESLPSDDVAVETR